MKIRELLESKFPEGTVETTVSNEFFGDLLKGFQRSKVARINGPRQIDKVIKIISKHKVRLQAVLRRNGGQSSEAIPVDNKKLLRPLVSNKQLSDDITAGIERELKTMEVLLVDYMYTADKYMAKVV